MPLILLRKWLAKFSLRAPDGVSGDLLKSLLVKRFVPVFYKRFGKWDIFIVGFELFVIHSVTASEFAFSSPSLCTPAPSL